tara:strand:- start:389 stop:1294 length:906 start_codon:yes stop_codon:yes gene_type:complete
MKKSIIIQFIKIIIILLSFWFIGEKLWTHQNWLGTVILNKELILIIIICSIIYGLSEFLLSFAWKRLLILCGHKDISLRLCNSIYGKSQIAKYIPGNVFHVIGRHILGSQAGVKHIVLTGAAIYEILGLLLTSLIISCSGIFLFGLGNIYLSSFQMILSLLTIITTTIFGTFIAPYLMRLRGIVLPNQGTWVSIRNIYSIYLLYLIFFLIAGFLLVLIVNIFFDINFLITANIITIFSMAWFAGFIIPGAPGGIGVREAIIILFLTPIIGEAESVAAAVSLRFVTLLGDVWFFTISDKKFI